MNATNSTSVQVKSYIPKQEKARMSRTLGNIVAIRPKRPANYYIYLIKELFKKDNYPTVEVHAIGDANIVTATKALDLLTLYKYCLIKRLKTKTI